MIAIFLKEDTTEKGEAGFRVHLTQVGTMDAMAFINPAKKAGFPISIDLAPHFLHFTDKDARDNPLLKSFPPITTAENRDVLVAGVKEGKVDLIASDHFPSMPKEKHAKFSEATYGITGLQYMLPVVWTAISSTETTTEDLELLNNLLSTQPAKLLKLGHAKGRIAAGYDADFVVRRLIRIPSIVILCVPSGLESRGSDRYVKDWMSYDASRPVPLLKCIPQGICQSDLAQRKQNLSVRSWLRMVILSQDLWPWQMGSCQSLLGF